MWGRKEVGRRVSEDMNTSEWLPAMFRGSVKYEMCFHT